MCKSVSLFFLALFMATVTLSACDQSPPRAQDLPSGDLDEEAIIEAVHRVQNELFAANERLDLDAFLSHLAEGFIMAKEGAIMPLSAFSDHLAEDFSGYDHHEIEWKAEKVSVLTSMAVVITASLDWTAVNRQGDVSWKGPLAWTAVFEQRAGIWKLTHGHLSWAAQQ